MKPETPDPIVKFIAWVPHRKMMANVQALYWDKGTVAAALLKFGDHETVMSQNLFKLLEFSNMYDINKKELYEGWVVRQMIPNEFGSVFPSIGIVIRMGGMFFVQHNNALRIPEGVNMTAPEYIGDIYQNPELAIQWDNHNLVKQ